MTTKAILKAKNKAGLWWIYVVYSHQSKNFPVATNTQIKVEDWDKKKSYPKDRALKARIEGIEASLLGALHLVRLFPRLLFL